MDILLTNDVGGLGDIGEIVSVRPGYARNFLLPNGLAVEARAGSSKEIAHKLRQVEVKKRKLKAEAEQSKDEWAKKTITLGLRVGSGGRVFGSLNAKDIAEQLSVNGPVVDRRRILLTDSLRKLGDHTVKIKLHAEVIATFTVKVVAMKATEEEEKKASADAMIALDKAKRKKAEKMGDEDVEVAEEEGEDTGTE